MTKSLSIAFSFLILFQSFNISLEDFSRLNTLLEHASFHQENYGDSFFEFLAEHYGKDFEDHSNEHDEHEDLPFKHDQQTCNHLNIDFTLSTYKYQVATNVLTDIPLNFYYSEMNSLFEKPSVFQPPKNI